MLRFFCKVSRDTIDVEGLYINAPYDGGLSELMNFPKAIVKNNTFHVSKRTLKQKQGTAIRTKFTPPYSQT